MLVCFLCHLTSIATFPTDRLSLADFGKLDVINDILQKDAMLTRWFAGDVGNYHCGKGVGLASQPPPITSAERYVAALTNARRFDLVAVLEEAALSMKLLQHVMGLPFTPTLPHTNGCSSFVPLLVDIPSIQLETWLRQDVFAHDIKLHQQLILHLRERVDALAR